MGDPTSNLPRQPPVPPPTTSNEQPPEPGQPAGPPRSSPPADGPPPLRTYQRRRRKPTGPPPATQKEGQLSGHSSGDENILPVKKRLFCGDGCGDVGPLPEHQPKVIRFRCGSSSQSTSIPPASDPQSHPPSPSAQTSPRHQEAGPPSLHAILLLLQLQSRRTYFRPRAAPGPSIPPGRPMGPPSPRTGPLDRPSQPHASYASLPLKKRDFPGGHGDSDEPPPPAAFAWP